MTNDQWEYSSISVIHIEITNQQDTLPVDEARIRRAVEMILEDAGIREAEISVAVVDDLTIHALNRQFLSHDEPTDVLSFVLEQGEASLEGEVIVSADTARASAPEYGWEPVDELLLYVIHGTLHLVGGLDATPEEQADMRAGEREYLARFGLEPCYDDLGKESL
jgi:probable rRNA maturation factor